ncbi:NADH dehydrogenase (ubiquinone) B14.5 B subunit isoform X2 [Xylocopa sonorina]|uniref:NADH dehydrogenase (ubiquinone) B14.5 B subunit isoform X2 n=1 Tax=Xylocopa sonorina TaxID=1818115 RepID=UPI00403AE03C
MDNPEEKFPAQWALDLLEPTEIDYTQSLFKNFIALPAAFAGYVAVRMRNSALGRPPHFNTPLILAITAVTGALGFTVQEISRIVHARRDASMREYIMLHPERFPEPGE